MPGKYIFPGAEVYTEPEDYDQCSLSANSESTDSDSDISSGEEEDDEEEGTCKFHIIISNFLFILFLLDYFMIYFYIQAQSMIYRRALILMRTLIVKIMTPSRQVILVMLCKIKLELFSNIAVSLNYR